MTKFFNLYDRFSDSNQNFTTEHVKIPGFSRIPGKVTTLILVNDNLGYFYSYIIQY